MKKKRLIWKGVLIGGVIGLIFSIIVNLVLSRDFYHFLNFLPIRFLILLMLIFIFGSLGLFVGFLSSLTSDNFILKISIFGGIAGFIFSIFVMIFWEKFEWIIKPISDFNTLITGCEDWCIYMIFVYPIIFIFLFVFVFSTIAFIISKLKGRNIHKMNIIKRG